MARPGKDTTDYPLRLTKAGMSAIDAEAEALSVDKADVIRAALAEYFERRGKSIQFAPAKPGGERRRMTEQQAIERVKRHIQALGLPEPSADLRVGQKRYDLAWPEQQKAIDVSMRKRPADTNGWDVLWLKPDISDSKMDEALRVLLE